MTIVEQCQGFHQETRNLAIKTHLNVQDATNYFRWLYVAAVIEECKGNRSQAARVLGIHRNTMGSLLRKMRAEGFPMPAGKPGNQQRKRLKSIVDHRGIELRRSATAWRQQQ